MAGSWTLTEELFARGDASFVAELRQVHAPVQLGAFAEKWLNDPRPFARQALFDYLALPFNSYRHEPLVKRLFKLAEAANDDELMGAFLVAFDRTIRRRREMRYMSKYKYFDTQAEAEAAVRTWEADGFRDARVNSWRGNISAHASKYAEVVIAPGGTTMPRPEEKRQKRVEQLNEWHRQYLERKCTLFTPATRRYLRRRAWRYFRQMGKADSARYIKSAGKFLPRYRDADVDSDIHLLDNWGLTHALFHHSPDLNCPAKGWEFAEGKGLADLTFAPYFEDGWNDKPETAFDLLIEANCRTVRLFAVWLLHEKFADWVRQRPVETLLKLADHPDTELSAFGFSLLETADDLSEVPISEWLRRLEGDDLDRLTRLSDLLQRRLDASRIGNDDAIRLAMNQSKPVAALGLQLLRGKTFTTDDRPTLLKLVQAECDTIRPQLTAWLRQTLEQLGRIESATLMEFLDSKHADVRQVGWDWLLESPLKDDSTIWHKLIESPYEDVRILLSERLATISTGADASTLRQLWAVVLLSIHRGGRQKPGVVAQIVDRAEKHPDEANELLPLLAIALRSLRGPEFRAGLTGVVMLSETKPELLPLIQQQFPELSL